MRGTGRPAASASTLTGSACVNAWTESLPWSILGLTKPSNWDAAFRAFGQRWADHVGLDQTGRDGVDADALESDLVGDAAGEGLDGALGCCVGDDAGEAVLHGPGVRAPLALN